MHPFNDKVCNSDCAFPKTSAPALFIMAMYRSVKILSAILLEENFAGSFATRTDHKMFFRRL